MNSTPPATPLPTASFPPGPSASLRARPRLLHGPRTPPKSATAQQGFVLPTSPDLEGPASPGLTISPAEADFPTYTPGPVYPASPSSLDDESAASIAHFEDHQPSRPPTSEQGVQVPDEPPEPATEPAPLSTPTIPAPTAIRVLPKLTFLPQTPPISFALPSPPSEPPYKGLTLQAAQWTFSSIELQTLVSAAIRQSAKESSISLLSVEALQTTVPTERDRLEAERMRLQAEYRFLVGRRSMILQSVLSTVASASFGGTSGGTSAGGRAQTPSSTVSREPEESSEQIVSQLALDLFDISAKLDGIMTQLLNVTASEQALRRALDRHYASALAIALRKLNASYGRRTEELRDMRARVAELEREVEEAWAVAEGVAREADEVMEAHGLEADSDGSAFEGEMGADDEALVDATMKRINLMSPAVQDASPIVPDVLPHRGRTTERDGLLRNSLIRKASQPFRYDSQPPYQEQPPPPPPPPPPSQPATDEFAGQDDDPTPIDTTAPSTSSHVPPPYSPSPSSDPSLNTPSSPEEHRAFGPRAQPPSRRGSLAKPLDAETQKITMSKAAALSRALEEVKEVEANQEAEGANGTDTDGASLLDHEANDDHGSSTRTLERELSVKIGTVTSTAIVAQATLTRSPTLRSRANTLSGPTSPHLHSRSHSSSAVPGRSPVSLEDLPPLPMSPRALPPLTIPPAPGKTPPLPPPSSYGANVPSSYGLRQRQRANSQSSRTSATSRVSARRRVSAAKRASKASLRLPRSNSSRGQTPIEPHVVDAFPPVPALPAPYMRGSLASHFDAAGMVPEIRTRDDLDLTLSQPGGVGSSEGKGKRKEDAEVGSFLEMDIESKIFENGLNSTEDIPGSMRERAAAFMKVKSKKGPSQSRPSTAVSQSSSRRHPFSFMPSLLSSNPRSSHLDEVVEQPVEGRHSMQRSVSSLAHDGSDTHAYDYHARNGSSGHSHTSSFQMVKSFSGPGESSSSISNGVPGHTRSQTSPVRRSVSEYGALVPMRPVQPTQPQPYAKATAQPQKPTGSPENKALRKSKGLLGKSLQALRSAGHSGVKRYSVATVPAGSNEGIGGVPQLRTVSEEREEGGKRPHTPPLAKLL